jgi:hypothetical protein
MPCSGQHSPADPLSEFTSFSGRFTPIPHWRFGMNRRTLAQQNQRSGNYYHIYQWTNNCWELHVHFRANGSINWAHTKLKCRRCAALKYIPSPPAPGDGRPEPASNRAARETVSRAIAGTAAATTAATTSVARTPATRPRSASAIPAVNRWTTGGNTAAALFGSA